MRWLAVGRYSVVSDGPRVVVSCRDSGRVLHTLEPGVAYALGNALSAVAACVQTDHKGS